MSKVLFIGDEPSSKNYSSFVAFVGTKSGETLDAWAKVLDIDYYAINSHDPTVLESVLKFYDLVDKPVIVLGNKAEKRTESVIKRLKLKLNPIKMPHPSPRNRKLNDASYVVRMLEKTKRELRSKLTNH